MEHAIATELRLLSAATVLGLVQLFVAGTAARGQQGLRWGAGPRDEPRPTRGVAARLERAFANFMETYPFFAASLLAATWSAKLGPLTLWGSLLYVGARVLYVPLYAAGVPFVRTAVWHVAVAGICMILTALFV
jgi:uncharacterized MAPEG superfamily protein